MKNLGAAGAIALAVLVAMLSSGCSTTNKGFRARIDSAPINPMTEKTAARFAPYAMMAANAYNRQDEARFQVERLGWRHVDLQGNPTSSPTYENILGLAFDIYKLEANNKYVFVFRGTDSILDYLTANLSLGISPQYKSANKQFRRFREAHPDATIVAVGHSLGGGLALSISVHNKGVDAIAFDSSPRVFDGLSNRHQPALREMVYENGEVLTKLRRISTKFPQVVKGENVYECDCSDGQNKHSARALAEGLLHLGKEGDLNLRNAWDALPAGTE